MPGKDSSANLTATTSLTQPKPRAQFTASVAANIPLCREHYRLVLTLPFFPQTQPGQFIQISCRDLDMDFSPETEFDWAAATPLAAPGQELMSPLAFLRRPFSLAGRRDSSGKVELDIIHRVVGIGTDWMAQLKTGQCVHLLGPLGNTFTRPSSNGLAILVGGGVGIPPMLYLAAHLERSRGIAFCGALSRDLLPLTILDDSPQRDANSIQPRMDIGEFSRHGIASVITTDDGSFGQRGFVTQALERYLDEQFTPDASRADMIIYTCGPELMMKRVADIAKQRNIDCQVAVERAMACGMGTCQSCCIRVRKPDRDQPPLVGQDWCYRLACTDGPVFRGVDLLW